MKYKTYHINKITWLSIYHVIKFWTIKRWCHTKM